MHKNSKRNINKELRFFYLFYVLFTLNPFSGVIVLYLMFIKNLDYFQVSLFFSLYIISIAIFEIPTGIVADRISRKISVLSGKILELILFLILPFLSGFYWILGWAVGWGISESLKSGAVSAWMYDNLKYRGVESAYSRVLSRLKTLGKVSSFSALLVGGAVSLIDYNYTILLSIILMLSACTIGLWLPEYPYKKVVRNYWLHSRDAFKLILQPTLLNLIILSLIVESILGIWSTFAQKYLYMIFPNTVFVTGILALGIIGQILGYNMPSKEKICKYLPSLIAVLIIFIGSIPLLFPGSYSIIVLPIIFLLYIFISSFEIVWGIKFQQEVTSEFRASAMSIYGAVATLSISVVVISVGSLADNVGLHRAMLIGGFFLLFPLFLLYLVYMMKKNLKRKKQGIHGGQRV